MSRGAGRSRDTGVQWPVGTVLLAAAAFVLSACTGTVGTADDTGTTKYALCTGTVTTASATPVAAGTQESFTVTPSCGTGETPEYKLQVKEPGASSYTQIQAWQDSNTLTWTPTRAGTFAVRVTVRAKNTTDESDIDSSYTVAGCSSVTGAVSTGVTGADGTIVAVIGTTVQLSATSTCDSGYTPEYQFLYAAPASPTWVALNSFGTANTFSWPTGSLVVGSYRVMAHVRHAGSTATESEGTFSPVGLGVSMVNVTPCTAVSLTFDPASNTAAAGTPVTMQAAATCPNGVIPEFAYWTSVGDPASQSATWTLIKNWSRDTTATFAGTVAGTNGASVIVRATGNTEDWGDAYRTLPYVYTGTTVTSCPNGTGTLCGTLCVDTNTDPLNCGTCGNDCTLTGQACSSGTCFTPACSAVTGSGSPNPALITSSVTLTGSATCDTGTAEYRFSTRAPSQNWVVVRDFQRSTAYTWNTTGATEGTYDVKIEARHTGSTGAAESETTFTETLVASASCSAVEVTATPSYAAIGDTIAVSGTATCNIGNAEYQISREDPSTPGNWIILQAWSTTNSYNWVTSGQPAATHRLKVSVRHAGSTGAEEAVNYANVTLVQRCTAIAMSTSPAGQTTAGSPVVISATGTCPGTTPEYQYWRLDAVANVWLVIHPWSTDSSYTWDTSQLSAGTYRIAVSVRYGGSSGGQDTFTTQYYTLTVPGNCTAVSMSASPTSAPAGSTVQLSASGTCTGGTPEYQYWRLDAAANVWVVTRAWSTSSTFNWDTTGLAAGTYRIAVSVRHGGSTGDQDAFTTQYYTLTVPGNCTAVSMSASPSTAPAGSTVQLSATGTCTGAAPEYQYWRLDAAANVWVVTRAWSTSSTFNWDTTGLAAGTYRIAVSVRHGGSTGDQDAFTTQYYTLTVPSNCTAVTMSASPSTAPVGSTVRLSANGTCTGGAPDYQYWRLDAAANVWVVIRPWSTTATFDWDTSSLTAGTYRIAVSVRHAGSTGGQDTYTTQYYTLTASAPATCTSIQMSASPTTQTTVGSPVTISATSQCTGGAPEYQYWWLDSAANVWLVLQPWTTSSSYVWDTSGFTPRLYRIAVSVRHAGSTGGQDTYTTQYYTLTQ